MPPHPRFTLLALATVLLIGFAIVATLSGSPGRSSSPSASGTSTPSGFDGAPLPAGVRAHGFALTDQRGRPVSLRDYRGRVTILTFLYATCRRACVLLAQQIRGALDELGPGVGALAVSLDPAGDTRAHVDAFLERVALGGRLRYLTGSPAQLEGVWRAYRVLPASAGESAYAMSAPVLLLDRKGRERVVFQLEQLTPEALAHDVRRLQSEP
jgi:protein SCO1